MSRKWLLSRPTQEPAMDPFNLADDGSKPMNKGGLHKQLVHLWNSLPGDTLRARTTYNLQSKWAI